MLREFDHEDIEYIFSESFSNDDFVWVISGYTSLKKGIEFVIPLLKSLKSNAKIIWLGFEVDRGINFYVKETIENNFPGQMLFLGQQKEFYYDYMNCADAFLLLSREDAFPLVMLEAAYLGKPIVSFSTQYGISRINESAKLSGYPKIVS